MLHKTKSHKKILSIIMVLVMAASLFTGCSMTKTAEKTEGDGHGQQQGSQMEDAGNEGEKGGEAQDAEEIGRAHV